MRHVHDFEWDDQAKVSQCFLCGRIRYVGKNR
jgi:hypothetical protein